MLEYAVFVFLLSAVTGAEGADEPCEPAWFLAGSKCYSVIPIPKTWNEAISLCESSSFNGTLVELETITEKASLISHLKTTYEIIFIGQEFWVGATGGRSVFVWYKSKTPLTYPDYMDGVGNGVGCLSFGIPTLQKYRVGPCTTKHLVICEKSPASAAGATSQTTPATMVG